MELTIQPLTADAFASFGEVIELATAKQFPINDGLTTRFHDLCSIDTGDQGGKTIVNVFRTRPIPLPHTVVKMERHPLGSQAFLPMDDQPFLVLVARKLEKLTANDLSLFITNGRQGVNFHKNTWHHFQLGIGEERDFIVIDRGGSGENLQEVELEDIAIVPDPSSRN